MSAAMSVIDHRDASAVLPVLDPLTIPIMDRHGHTATARAVFCLVVVSDGSRETVSCHGAAGGDSSQ